MPSRIQVSIIQIVSLERRAGLSGEGRRRVSFMMDDGVSMDMWFASLLLLLSVVSLSSLSVLVMAGPWTAVSFRWYKRTNRR